MLRRSLWESGVWGATKVALAKRSRASCFTRNELRRTRDLPLHGEDIGDAFARNPACMTQPMMTSSKHDTVHDDLVDGVDLLAVFRARCCKACCFSSTYQVFFRIG